MGNEKTGIQGSSWQQSLISAVYGIVNRLTGDCYVGSAQALGKRLAQHLSLLRRGKHHSIHLQRAWDKYGADNFEFLVLQPVADVTTLRDIEQQWLDSVRDRGCSYNIGIHATCAAAGRKFVGRKMPPRTAEHLARHAAAVRGKIFTAARRAKIAVKSRGRTPPNKGKPHSAEARRKISMALKGRPGGMLGKQHSAETKQKMRVARLGWIVSDETRIRMREAHVGKAIPQEQREKIRFALIAHWERRRGAQV